jgi:hypothetical protein
VGRYTPSCVAVMGTVHQHADGGPRAYVSASRWGSRKNSSRTPGSPAPRVVRSAGAMAHCAGEARHRAVRLLSEMVGALMLARAVRHVEPELSDEILQTGRSHALD